MGETNAEHSEDDHAVEFYVLEGIEPMSRYCPGGYHKVAIGDRLNHRYQIIHKLGYGTYSTVWLAWDDHAAINVAIKIALADNERPKESEIMSGLHGDDGTSDAGAQTGRAAIPVVLDEFEVTGTNGTHYCLVTPAARFSMDDLREPGEEHPLQAVHAIAAQVAQAIVFLHEKGVVHGDLTLGNILLELPENVKRMPAEELYQKYGEPQRRQVKRIDGKPLGEGVPRYGVNAVNFLFETGDITLHDSKVLLSDFGESYQPSATPRTESNAPGIYQPPEQFLEPGREISFESDIWALGCVIFAMLGYRHVADLFDSKDYVLYEHVDAFGPFPVEMWEAWENRGKYYTEDQQDKRGYPQRDFHERLIESIVEPRDENPSIGQLEPEELRALEEMFRSIFALKVEDRPTAQQVLESEWVTKWALPDLERARELWEQEKSKVEQGKSKVDDAAEARNGAGDQAEEHKGAGEGAGGHSETKEAALPPEEHDTKGDQTAARTAEGAATVGVDEDSSSKARAGEADGAQKNAVTSEGRKQSGQAPLHLAVKKQVDGSSAEEMAVAQTAGEGVETFGEKGKALAVEKVKESETTWEDLFGQAKQITSSEEASEGCSGEGREIKASQR